MQMLKMCLFEQYSLSFLLYYVALCLYSVPLAQLIIITVLAMPLSRVLIQRVNCIDPMQNLFFFDKLTNA